MGAVFIQSMIVGFSGSVMPGPLLTYTLQKSMGSGARAGALIVLGHALLEILLILLLFAGLARFLETELARQVISLLGGGLLLFLGGSMIRSAITG